MGKHDKSLAITQSAGLAARAMARLEASAAEVHAGETERRLQLVSSPGSLSALIKPDGVMIQIENGTFAVTTD
jgi:hypothetical protein